MGIVENLTNSFIYAADGLFGKWGRWIALIIGTIIFPIIMGYTLRVMKGGESPPESDNYVGMYFDGWKMIIINLHYFIPLIIGIVIFAAIGGISAFTMGYVTTIDNLESLMEILFGTLGVSLIIFIMIAIIIYLFATIGMVRFARTGSMGEAFAFSEILAKIGSIGWATCIIALIIINFVMMIIYVILEILSMVLGLIPLIGSDIGSFIGWLLTLILAPYLTIVSARFYSLLYDSGV